MRLIESLVEKYDHLINTDAKYGQRPGLSNDNLYLCPEDEKIGDDRNET